MNKTNPPREFWEEYERRKAKIQNIGLSGVEYDRAVAQILEDLDSEFDGKSDEEVAA